MVAFSSINVGDRLYDAGTYRMGNTTRRAVGNWEVIVQEIDQKGRRILASWNGNPAKWLRESQTKRLRRTPKKERQL